MDQIIPEEVALQQVIPDGRNRDSIRRRGEPINCRLK
jgi:hypothetical protein